MYTIPSNGCLPVRPPPRSRDWIAIMRRGSCEFSTKVQHLQNARAPESNITFLFILQRVGGRVGGWAGGWVRGRYDAWVGGCMDGCIQACIHL